MTRPTQISTQTGWHLAPEHVAGVVGRSIRERVQGAQWVIWPGQEPHAYEWNPAVTATP